MHILHINCNYTGTTLHQCMIEKLDKLDIENKVYVPTYDSRTAVIKPNSNVIVSECFKKYERIVFDLKQKSIYDDIQSKVDVSNYNCIHAHTLFTDGNCAMKLSKKYGIPYIVAIRNTDVNTFLKKMVHLRSRGIKIMKNASAIIFLSDAYRRVVFEKYVPHKYYSEFYNKTYVIPNGIDDFWFNNIILNKKSIEKNKELKIVYAGKIDKNKNISTTQKAVHMLEKKGYNVVFTVVGKVKDKNEYDKIKNDKTIKYIAAQPKEELIKIYRENDIFVMPSFKETFGLVYAEAMSQGLPVIYTKNQGFDGQFPNGTVGYSVDPSSSNDIVDCIERIISNYNNITKKLNDCVIKFSWDDIVKEYQEIYNGVII